MNKTIKIGLTGSIGSGKSTILAMLGDRGFYTVSLDDEAKKIYSKGTDAYKKIVDFFGKNILNKEYEINKKSLAGIIFSEPSKKKALESIIYPQLRKNIEQIIGLSRQPFVAIEGAVIIESGFYRKLDNVVLVTCDFHRRLSRSLEKFDIEDFLKRNGSQLSQEEKIKKSDFLINNNYGLKFLPPQVENLIYYLTNAHGSGLTPLT